MVVSEREGLALLRPLEIDDTSVQLNEVAVALALLLVHLHLQTAEVALNAAQAEVERFKLALLYAHYGVLRLI